MSFGLHRRRFLALGAGGLGAWATLGRWPASAHAEPLPTPAASPRPRRVAIVGAGLAGLAAAYDLQRAGHHVTVLEARRRPGGRVLTARDFPDGLHAELGAARIPSTHELTLRYAEHFDLTVEPFRPMRGDALDVVRGTRVRTPEGSPPDMSEYPLQLTDEERELGAGGLFRRLVAEYLPNAGDAASDDWPPPALRSLDALTLHELVESRGLSADVAALLGLGFLDAGDRPVSMLWLLRAALLSEGAPLRIVGGTDRLPRAFAGELGAHIRYGTPVVRVEHTDRHVRITRLQAGVPRFEDFDRVILTVPFSVLRQIRIEPELPADRRRAIAEMTYAPAGRAVVQVGSRYWEEGGLSGYARLDTPSEIWHETHSQPGPRALLTVSLKGSAARRLRHLENDARFALARAEIQRAFPGVDNYTEGGIVKFWDEDEWAGGAYAQPSPGEMTGLLVEAEKPIGRVHFAGEHLSAWNGWMEGALHSGRRAAREVESAKD